LRGIGQGAGRFAGSGAELLSERDDSRVTAPNAEGVDQAVTASILEQAAPHPKAVFRSPAPTQRSRITRPGKVQPT
jgi:hypothetical protein